MASNLLLIVLLVLFSLSVTSVYSLSTRNAVSTQDDEYSYFMAKMSDQQGSSMIDVEDLAKARSLQALVAVNKNSKSKSTKSSKKKKKKIHNVAIVAGIIILVILLIILIISTIFFCFLKHIAKTVQSTGNETQHSKREDYV